MYELSWYEQTLEMQKNFLNILVYQKPVTFSISYIVPELSLRYYCSVRQISFQISFAQYKYKSKTGYTNNKFIKF